MFMQPIRFARRTALGAGLAASATLVWSAAPATAHDSAALADLVDQVAPAVVTVLSESEGGFTPAHAPGARPGSPFEEFFRHFGPQDRGQPHKGPRSGLGSGFILEQDGWIVTNHHVVEGADTVTVRLSDRREFEAEIIGVDAPTDLALLRIDAGDDLPHVELGDSEALRVGEEVFAVGNPFGLGGTVTKGIVSAKGRDIDAGPYADFIQTDAAINRGNSGGPLFNMEGEVIGVNSAIYSPNGGSVGLGFSVASHIVEQVVADLREDGTVSRGWLGVSIQTISPEIAEAMGLDGTDGALVSQVVADSPAADVLRTGDVILGFDGQALASSRDLPKLVGAKSAGDAVEVDILRDGAEETVQIEIGTLAPKVQATADADPAANGPKLGVTIAELTPEARTELGLDADVEGVVVTSLAQDSAAQRAGLRVGDVIVTFDATRIDTPEDLRDAVGDSDDTALALINRKGNQIFVPLKLG